MRLTLLLVCAALFPATHILLSHGRIRAALVAVLRPRGFRVLYGAVALVTLGAAAVAYWGHAQTGPRLWQLPPGVALGVAAPLTALAFFLLFQSLATPSPAGMIPARKELRGVLRITRHPMNIGLAAWGLAHVVASGFLSEVAFFGGFVVLGLLGAYHQDRRLLRDRGEGYRAFVAATSVLPFAAVLQRRTPLAAHELNLPMAIVALVVGAAAMWFHGVMFGVSLL
jgi:uncharacterized membrane protein